MLRYWFVTGFLITFFGMAAIWPMHFHSGQALHQMRLWQYYLREIQLAINSSGALGATSGNMAAALGTAVVHLAISAVVGSLSMGIGWVLQKRAPD